ncbi:transposase family protein [Microcoleus sp. Pol14C6]|uniref:transposase family protein n=1 Tax=unclassified Microcoleus TaxID=2642155 RepID=UPI002FD29CA1
MCSHCDRSSHRLHQNQEHLVKDLPMGNREIVLRVNGRQFKCDNCETPFSETLSFVAQPRSFTNKYALMSA